MVDVERIRERLELLDTLLPALEQISAGGKDTYIAEHNDQARLATERALQVALQICLDIGAHLISELGLHRPDDYRGVFKVFEALDHLDDLRAFAAAALAAAERESHTSPPG